MTYPALPTDERARGSDASAWPMAVAAVIATHRAHRSHRMAVASLGLALGLAHRAPVLLAVGVVTSTLIVDALPTCYELAAISRVST